MMYQKIFLILLLLLLLQACSDAEKPPQSASFQEFQTKIVPLIEKRCALSCHGVNNYDTFINKNALNAEAFYFPIDPMTGRIPQNAHSLLVSYQATRGWQESNAVHSTRIDYREEAHFSPLLRFPLAEDFGGLPHKGMDIFYSTEETDYKTLQHWIQTEIAEHPVPAQILPKETQFFKNKVLGVMVRNSCFLSSCHGSQVFNDLKLVPPLPVIDPNKTFLAGFSTQMVLHNHQTMLGTVSRFANLGGDVKRSRLLVKNIPISQGGVHQRGGNEQFLESFDDKDSQILIAWLELEKEALSQKLISEQKPISKDQLGKVQGLAFIRSPKHNPRHFFEFDEFFAGSNIYLLKLDTGETLQNTQNVPTNLTAQDNVEIQSFDVRYDGKAIIFAMRTQKERGFRLYELLLDDELKLTSLQQLSFAAAHLKDGTLVHHIDPIYIPGAEDDKSIDLSEVSIAYASNEMGHYAASDTWGILGEADAGDLTTIIDYERTEAPGTFKGRRLFIVDGAAKGEWRTILQHFSDPKSVVGAQLVLDRPLPLKPNQHMVYVIEKLKAKNVSAYDIWSFVPKKGFKQTKSRMTFTSAQERRPTMRSTGEVMFTSVRNIGYQADRPVFNGAIFRVQAGGFDYHVQGGNRSRYPIYADSRELPSGLEIRVALDPRNYWGGGMLFLVDHGLGINLEPNNPVDNIPFPQMKNTYSSPPRFLPTQLPFYPETGENAVTVTGISPGGAFRDPFPLPNGQIVTAHVHNPIDHLDPNANPDWDIYLISFDQSLQTEDAQGVGSTVLQRIASTSQFSEYSPRPIMVRLKEKAHTHQKFTKTAQTKRIHGVLRAPPETAAEIICFDYPLLQSFLTHFAPVGSRDFHEKIPEQKYHYVRLIMHVPPHKKDLLAVDSNDPFATPLSLGIHTQKRIIAEIPLSPDGSFYTEAPTHVPLIIQGLNQQKMALHSMNRWFYVQPGEKLTFSIPRTIFTTRCSGCHGALTGKETDGVGAFELVSAASKVMANWDNALKEQKSPFGASSFISIDFKRDIQAILDKHCVSCHHSTDVLNLKGTPTTHYTVSYETLHQLREPASGNYADKKYVNEREALAIDSLLIQKIKDKKHPINNSLTDHDLLTLIRWIDLGATFK